MSATKMRLLPYVVFCSGAAGMSLQLIGSRLLAPHFGSSVFVWTSLIGVMLGFMALGNFLGGRLADRNTSPDLLFWVLVLLSSSISLVAMVGAWALGMFTEIPSLRLGMVLGSTMLFAIPCTLFGTVTPAAIRLRMQAVSDSGANVGTLSAVSMMGSIAGTFATGFWLIALVGSRSLLAWLALLIVILACVMGLSRQNFSRGSAGDKWRQGGGNTTPLLHKLIVLGVAAVLIVGAFVWHPQAQNLQDMRVFDSLYGQYLVGEVVINATTDPAEPADFRTVRYLANNPRAWESAVFADNFEPFFFEYYRFYDIAAAISAEPRTTLMIGGGAFVYPRFFFQQYPDAVMDVVEIDPALLYEAKENFGLVPQDNLNVYLEDGRMFLNRAVRQGGTASTSDGLYDLAIMDAFNSANNVPFQLTTRESMQHIADLMTDEGVFVMNLIVSVEGEGSQFLASQYLTLREVFPQVEAYIVRDGAIEAGVPRNVAIIATNGNAFDLRRTIEGDNPELADRRIDASAMAQMPGAMVLTDDFAPVDQMLSGVNH